MLLKLAIGKDANLGLLTPPITFPARAEIANKPADPNLPISGANLSAVIYKSVAVACLFISFL